MVLDDVKLQLSDSIDDYIDFWKQTLEDLDRVYPADKRSRELDDIMSGLKGLIGTHSISQNISEFISGNHAAKFDPYINRLSARLLPVGGHTTTPEKKFFSDCFDTDNKEDASKLLRFIYMVEFESQTLHYALVARDWLLDDDIRLSSYVQSKHGLMLEMNELIEQFSEVSRNRPVTEKLFHKDWSYGRNTNLRDRVVSMSTGLRAAHDSIKQAFTNEKTVDDKVAATQKQLFEAMQTFQQKTNEILKDSDKIHVVQPVTPQKQDSPMMSWFSQPKTTPSGLAKTAVKDFHSGAKYHSHTVFLQTTMNDLFASYDQILTTMREFQGRERERDVSLSRLRYWHESSDSLVRSLLDDKSSKNCLPEKFYSAMHHELKNSTTSKDSLCEKFENFFISRAALLSDGNWSDPEALHYKQSPQDCLKRSNIAKFRKYLLDYKSDSKSQRLYFSRINRLLIFSSFLFLGFVATRAILLCMPANVQSLVVFKSFLSFTLPAVVNIILPIAVLALIALNWRNANGIKSSFIGRLQCFSEDSKRGEIDRSEQQPLSFFSWLGQSFNAVIQWFNCFRASQGTDDQLVVEEDGQFVGVRSQSLSSSNGQDGSNHLLNSSEDQNRDVSSVVVHKEQRNYGRYGAQNHHLYSQDAAHFETVALDDPQDPTSINHR